jgi:drug/metabolite transporter (DMT)-like permease
MTATLYSSLFMALIALCVSNPKGIAVGAMQKPVLLIPMLIGLGVITFVLPYVLYSSAIKVLPAGTASALSIVEPMAATLFSVFLFHEKLTLYSCIGIVMILMAVLLLGRTNEKGDKT